MANEPPGETASVSQARLVAVVDDDYRVLEALGDLLQVSRQYGLRELFLVSAVISLALRFGGRSDQVLERMAGFMRDLEHARDELTALSAEIRLSAWILALLPIGLGLFIITFNNALFVGMWNDPLGFRMLLVAAGLQIGGSYWLYRMARAV